VNTEKKKIKQNFPGDVLKLSCNLEMINEPYIFSVYQYFVVKPVKYFILYI